MPSLHLLYALLFLTGIAFQAAAQPLLFENYSSKHGLSQHNTTAISQDNNGLMWIGTLDGLNRYDGNSFKVYLQQNDAGKKLPSNLILGLKFDSTSQLLWIGTARGVCVYDPKGDSLAFPSAYFPLGAGLDQLRVWKFFSPTPGEYWFVTTNTGLVYFNSKTGMLRQYFQTGEEKYSITDIVLHQGKLIVSDYFSLYTIEPKGDEFVFNLLLPGYRFPQIRTLESTGNRLWVGTISNGCYFIDGDPVIEKNIVASDLIFGGVEAIEKGNKNDVWFYTRGSGIYRYNNITGKLDRAIQNQVDPSSPVSNFGACIFTDRQGIVWLGASGGIVKFDTLRYQFQTVNGASSSGGSLSDNAIYSMFRTKDNRHFVGTQGKGLFEWNVRKQEFISFPESAVVEKANNVIYSITEDKKGNIWSATCGGLMQLNRATNRIRYFPEHGNKEHLNKMYAILKLKHADSLLVGAEGGLQFFSLKTMEWEANSYESDSDSLAKALVSFRSARYFFEEKNGTVWVCNEGIGLMKLSYNPVSVERVTAVNQLAKGVKFVTRNGRHLLVATNNGLLVYDDQHNKLVKQVIFRSANQSNVCHAIQTDSSGNSWISSNHGLYKLDSDYKVIQEYNVGNGLSFSEFNQASTLKDPDGRLYFGGMDGITVFYPSRIKSTGYSPAPIITSISVNHQPYSLNINPNLVDFLKLPYNKNFLNFHFAVANFSKESNCQFSYRLNGLNDEWSTPSRITEAIFTSLPPGNYTFELRASNSDGSWSEDIKRLPIRIEAAWWQNSWLQISMLLLIALGIAYLFQKRIKKIRQEAMLKNQMAEIEIKSLHTQMNPHFIFNALNSIKEMIWKDDKRNASRYLSKFALLIRTSLEHSRQPFITIQQCIDHLEQYLEMEKLRFEDFSYKIEVDPQLMPEDTRIAPMLIQPLVENAIWHGLRNKKQDRQLTIRFFSKSGRVICEVDDNGVGIKQTSQKAGSMVSVHKSVGLDNIRERLAVLNEKYKMNCSLKISDKSDLPGNRETGTLAVLELSI